MKRGADLLRRKVWLWLPPALLLAAASFFWFRQFTAVRTAGGALDRRLAAATAERDTARADAERLSSLAEAVEANRIETERLYGERFATESGRFTDLVREIKRLAEHAGLDPREISYPEETLDGFGLARRSFVFTVEGNYSNLRMFLHLIELSPSFVTVNEIKVSERKGKGLQVNLRLSTFFSTPAADSASDVRGAS